MTFIYSKYYVLSIIVSLFTIALFSQNKTTDTTLLFSKLYSFMYSNKDSTNLYVNKIIDVSKKEENYEYIFHALLFSNKSASYFNDYKTIKSNLNKIDSLLINKKKAVDTISSIHTIKLSFLYDKAIYSYLLNDYKKSQEHLLTLLINAEKLTDSLLTKQNTDLIYAAYATIAKIYSNDGKFILAKQHYDKSLRFVEKLNDKEKLGRINGIYRLVGELNQRQKNFKTSNTYLKKSLNYSSKVSRNENSIIKEANNIVNNYIALKQFDSAQYYLNYLKPLKDSNISYGFLFYKSRAQLNIANNTTETVIEDYTKAISLLTTKWKEQTHPEIAQAHQELSNFYFSKGNIKEALSENQLAINQVYGKAVINSSINNIEYLKLLKDKLKIQNNTKNYKNALKTSTLAIAVLDSLKPTFKNNTDKLLLVDNAFPIFENSLEALYQLNNISKNKKNITRAFNIIENSKSTLLLDALLSAKATSYASIPDSITEKEQVFKTEITRLEKRLVSSKNETLEEQLFKQKNEYFKFINTLESNYKSYYNLKYNTKVASLETIQAFLNTNDRLLSYFYGESSLFIINITKNDATFSKVNINDDLNELIKEVYSLLGNPKSNLKLLNSKSFALYSKVVAPYLSKKSNKNLIIQPDGLLNFIPFSGLATNKNGTRYLVEDYTVSYANSATLLLELQEKKENNSQVLAFAPTFNNTNLLALPNNIKEADNILSHFKGEAFKNSNATLKNFNTTSANYSILHLATHAIFNDKAPENSYLAFAYNNKEEQSLYVRDLYNLKLNSDLVTLSACESGIGNLNRGEGLMSLARGFYFSGANSIASTLWKINDASTTKLMNNFYLNLSKNETKNTALQNAKLSFINANRENALSHPYYWSAFVISGNTSALNTTNYWLWLGLPILIVLLLLLYFKRKN